MILRYVAVAALVGLLGSGGTYLGWIFGWHRGYDAGLEDAPAPVARELVGVGVDKNACLLLGWSDGTGELWCADAQNRSKMRVAICGALDI